MADDSIDVTTDEDLPLDADDTAAPVAEETVIAADTSPAPEPAKKAINSMRSAGTVIHVGSS